MPAEPLEIWSIFVQLMGERTVVFRPTTALHLGGDRYEILPTLDYNPEDEIWEFVPHTIAKCIPNVFPSGEVGLLAVAKIAPTFEE
jgi:hypothetical protein